MQTSLKTIYRIAANHKALVLIMIISLAVRFLYSLTIEVPILVSDSPTYMDGARILYEKLHIDIYRPPVYLAVIILASLAFGWHAGTVILQILLSLVCILLAYDIAMLLQKNRFFAHLSALMTGISISVYGWDFMIMSESLSLFLITLSCWLLLKFLYTRRYGYLHLVSLVVFLCVFTKPFFIVYPLVFVFIFIFGKLAGRGINLGKTLLQYSLGLVVTYTCLLGYFSLNYTQNQFYGFSAVGNVNSFGKVIQYHMEDLGTYERIRQDLAAAYEEENPADLVDGHFLEPWKFIGKYNWNAGNYREIGDFASQIMRSHPVKYTLLSLQLMKKVMVSQCPFKDFIAISAMEREGPVQAVIDAIRHITGLYDAMYFLILPGFLELLLLIFVRSRQYRQERFTSTILFIIILYHYCISTFFSYGDYCRLLAPSYVLMYILIGYYLLTLARLFTFVKLFPLARLMSRSREVKKQ